MKEWMIKIFIMILEKLLESDTVMELKVKLIESLREKAADSESPIDDVLVEFFAAILGV